MRNNFVLGFGLLMIGLSLVLIVAPYFTALGSSVWLDETFVVPEGYYYYYYSHEPFPSKTTLHITFEVTSGGDRSVVFFGYG